MHQEAPTYHRGYVYRISAVAALAGLLFGFDTVVINGALPFLREQFHLSDIQLEVLACAILLGAVIGALLSSRVSNRMGRRRVLIVCAIVFAAASLFSAVPSNVLQLEMARFAAGVTRSE